MYSSQPLQLKPKTTGIKLDNVLMISAMNEMRENQWDIAKSSITRMTDIPKLNMLLTYAIQRKTKEITLLLVGKGATFLWSALWEMQKTAVITAWTGKEYTATYEFLVQTLSYEKNLILAEQEQEREKVQLVLQFMVKNGQNDYFLKLIKPMVEAGKFEVKDLLEKAIHVGNGVAACYLAPLNLPEILVNALLQMQSFYTRYGWKSSSYEKTYGVAIDALAKKIGLLDLAKQTIKADFIKILAYMIRNDNHRDQGIISLLGSSAVVRALGVELNGLMTDILSVKRQALLVSLVQAIRDLMGETIQCCLQTILIEGIKNRDEIFVGLLIDACKGRNLLNIGYVGTDKEMPLMVAVTMGLSKTIEKLVGSPEMTQEACVVALKYIDRVKKHPIGWMPYYNNGMSLSREALEKMKDRSKRLDFSEDRHEIQREKIKSGSLRSGQLLRTISI